MQVADVIDKVVASSPTAAWATSYDKKGALALACRPGLAKRWHPWQCCGSPHLCDRASNVPATPSNVSPTAARLAGNKSLLRWDGMAWALQQKLAAGESIKLLKAVPPAGSSPAMVWGKLTKTTSSQAASETLLLCGSSKCAAKVRGARGAVQRSWGAPHVGNMTWCGGRWRAQHRLPKC